MGRTRLEILDPQARRQQTIGSNKIWGPAIGVRGISYVPTGGILNGIGSLKFRVPIKDRKNMAITEGIVMRVVDSDLGEMGTYIVDEHSEQQDGLDATFSCPDLMQELMWQTLPGYQSIPLESPTTTVQRLALLQLETPWSGLFKGAAVDYTGVGFLADKISIFQAYQQLQVQRGYNFRRGAGGPRVIEVGDFGEKSGIRLSSPSPVPVFMNRTNVRPIIDGGFNPKYDSGALVNLIIPSGGGGTGFAELNLGSLYNPVGEVEWTIGSAKWYSSGPLSFAGYDPKYPIWRRPRYDAAGNEYFLWDYSNIAKYRIRMLPFPVSHVAPVSGALADMQAAAAALYATAVSELKVRSNVNLVYDIATAANGDIRSVAGKYVTVYVPAADIINDSRRVVQVTRDIDDKSGAGTDKWLVSSSGRDTTSASGIQTGMLQTINYMRTLPALYPARIIMPGFANIDNANPHTFTLPGDTSVANRVSVQLTISCVPATSPVSTASSKGHTHTVTIPALTVNTISGGDHAHGGTTNGASAVSATANTTDSGTAANAPLTGGFTHRHAVTIVNQAQNMSIPQVPFTGAPARYVTIGGDGAFNMTFETAGHSGSVETGEELLTPNYSNTSHGHTTSGSGSGPANGTAAVQGITGYGGFAIGGVTTAAGVTTAPGGEHTHDLAWGVMKGPIPTYVSVKVDGVYALFQINSPLDTRKTAIVDLLPFTNDQRDHAIEISSATVGGVEYFLNERHRETTYNAA